MRFFTLLLFAAHGLTAAPNIIFILCDDLGYGDLGVTWQNERSSGKKHHTPHLDRMAAEGVLMDRHYCPAPVCAPSRGSFLTGFHQGHCGIRNNQFDKALPNDHTVASTLKAGGYRTALVGKYGLQGKGKNAAEWPAYPTKRGFDDFFGYVRHADGHVHYPAHEWPLGNSASHRSKKQVWWNDREVSATLDKCFTGDLFTAFAKKWIVEGLEEKPKQPFFLYLAYDTPHAALQLPTGPYPEGGGLEGGLQWTGKPGAMINTAQSQIDSWVHPDHKQPGWTKTEKRQAGMIRRLDDSVGDLLQLLKDLEIDDNTLVIFTSDNGPHDVHYLAEAKYDATRFQSYGPLNGIKRDVLEGGIRTPTLVRWPEKIPAGKVNDTPSQFHDWMTTFLAAAGLPLPAQADGVSLLATLTGQGEQEDSTVYVEYAVGGRTPNYPDFEENHRNAPRKEMQVVLVDHYKGIRTHISKPDQPFRIYDLTTDQREKNNLAGTSPQFEKLQKTMQERVIQIRRPNPSARRPYDSLPIPSISPIETEQGLRVKFQAGSFPWVPRLNELNETKVETLNFQAPVAGAVEYSGLLEISEEGEYTFELSGSIQAVLRLHQAIMIDTDSPSIKAVESAKGTVRLEKGLHPFRLSYLTNGPSPQLIIRRKGNQNFKFTFHRSL
ncbi:sulfatase-like hydrolase/transferase [Roseibacillus persicicus]|uniref:sulfatase-like hydrolase/transferase n=1 Tax=Roseibacillus persicicus TaxID=454148 RepID=UPI00398A6015